MFQASDSVGGIACVPGQIGRLGSLVSSVAQNTDAVEDALHLRYQVFQSEMRLGKPGSSPVDKDRWDEICDHLLIHETNPRGSGEPGLVATARLLRADVARQHGLPLYSQAEFDIATLMARHEGKNFLEIGRTCVASRWRSKRCIELLWHSIWAYALKHHIDVLVGCASFSGTKVETFADPLSYLYHNHSTDEEWLIEPAGHSVCMNLKQPGTIDQKVLFKKLPPLVKGYLRLGASTSRQAVIDHEFGTIDIFIVLPVQKLNPRHVAYYGKNAERHGTISAGQY